MTQMYRNMAVQLVQSGEFDQAEAIIGRLLKADPDDFDARLLMGRVHSGRGDIDSLLKECKTALDIRGLKGSDFFRIGQMFQEFGDMKNAAEAYRRAIDADSGLAYAYLALALVAEVSPGSRDIQLLEDRLNDPRANDEEKRKLCFGLGKIWDDLQDYDRAFGYFERGNQAVRRQDPYSIESDRRIFDAIKRAHDDAFCKRHSQIALDDATPIFIVGLPRCGSTLTEQILASHPEIVGAGEIDGFSRAVLDRSKLQGRWPLHQPDEESMHLARRECEVYIKRAKSMLDKESRITDKQLINFILVGFIGVLLPNASIIECRRDFRDQCVSMYQKDFSGGNYRWTYALDDLGQYCGLYQDLMQHWKSLFPAQIHTANYEQLVEHPESSVRSLLDHCSLPFDRACLSFYKTQRSINTFSFAQVRKPLYSSSVGRWKNYERHLDTLLSALPKA